MNRKIAIIIAFIGLSIFVITISNLRDDFPASLDMQYILLGPTLILLSIKWINTAIIIYMLSSALFFAVVRLFWNMNIYLLLLMTIITWLSIGYIERVILGFWGV